MAILTNSGRAAMASAIKDSTLYVAWGTGDPTWDDVNARESRNAIELRNEIGRVKVKTAAFCVPDDAGEIIMQGANFRTSTTPTANLHIKADFDFSDGLGHTIRELGVFIGAELNKGLPRGQRYYTPADLADKGILLALDHITPMERGVGSKVSFDFIISF